jgi:quercetin dioxygenase-like cupin family protein
VGDPDQPACLDPAARLLCDTREIASGQFGPDASGAVWKLQPSRRHLDANIIHLQPGSQIQAHAGPDLDVLWHILHGHGQLITEVDTLELRPEQLVWLPRLSRREIVAEEEGLTYLTVHPRRPGITIQPVPQQT